MAREESGATVGVGCVAVLLLIPIGILLKGFVISQLWAWFFVPFGLPSISLAHSYGIVILVGLFTSHGMGADMKASEDRSMAATVFIAVFAAIVMPLLAWFAGWLCHVYM